MKKQLIELGTFEVVSGVLRISDPCYDKDTWCAGSVDNVLNGTWKAQVKKVDMEDNWGNRCRKLVAVHESFDKSNCTFKKLKIDVGVDSGQAGIFDDKFYQVNYDQDYLQTGNCEYYQASDYYRAKENIKLYESMVKLNAVTSKQDKLTRSDDYFQHRLEEAKEIVARGPDHFDYSSATKTRDWYEICCDRTLSRIGAGVIRNGVVSSSGDGDGSYTAYAAYNPAGQVVGIKILF